MWTLRLRGRVESGALHRMEFACLSQDIYNSGVIKTRNVEPSKKMVIHDLSEAIVKTLSKLETQLPSHGKKTQKPKNKPQKPKTTQKLSTQKLDRVFGK